MKKYALSYIDYESVPCGLPFWNAYGPVDFAGKNFFHVCGSDEEVATRYGNFKRPFMATVQRMTSAWMDEPFIKRDKWRGTTEILLSGYERVQEVIDKEWVDEVTCESAFWKNRVSGKNLRAWFYWHQDRLSLIEFPDPTPVPEWIR